MTTTNHTALDDLLTGLDPRQAEAVQFPDAPLVVFAGAGSGKTRVLTYRVAWMLLSGMASPDSMFVSAFTKASADEMRERLVPLVGEQPDLVVGTFHSICFRLLQREREIQGLPRLDVCKESESTRIIRDLCGPKSRDYPEALDVDVDIAIVKSYISTWKNQLLHDDDEEILAIVDETPAVLPKGAAARAYALYQRRLAGLRKLDFDDMLLMAYDILATSEGARERARAQWNAFLIDEAQDTNVAQWGIVKMIAPPETHPNITIVGDTRQCLYRFRGAVPELMDGFDKMYPGATRIDLTMNYRSVKEVITRANRLVTSLGLPDQEHSRPGGKEAKVVHFDDQVEQATEIARFVVEARGGGYKGGDVAVMIRTNAQAAQLENAFVAARLPYWCKGGGFYQRMEVGDLVAYLSLAVKRDDEQALRRIINKPTRYLGAAFCDDVMKKAARVGGDIIKAIRMVDSVRGRALSKKQRDAALDLASLLEYIGTGDGSDNPMTPFAAIQRILDWTEYMEWLRKTSGSDDAIDDSRSENIEAFKSVAAQYSKIGALLEFIDTSTKLQQDTNDATELTTVHRAKGREWPIVIVSNFFHFSFPHKKAVEEGNMPDERRVGYVAVTRARDLLILAVPATDEKYGAVQPSPFLAEMGFEETEEALDDDLAKRDWWGDLLKPDAAAVA